MAICPLLLDETNPCKYDQTDAEYTILKKLVAEATMDAYLYKNAASYLQAIYRMAGEEYSARNTP